MRWSGVSCSTTASYFRSILPCMSVLSTSCTNNFPESLGLRRKVFQKIEELRMKTISVPITIPDEFLCPITRELMKDPVIAAGMSLNDVGENELCKGKDRSGNTKMGMSVLPVVETVLNSCCNKKTLW